MAIRRDCIRRDSIPRRPISEAAGAVGLSLFNPFLLVSSDSKPSIYAALTKLLSLFLSFSTLSLALRTSSAGPNHK